MSGSFKPLDQSARDKAMGEINRILDDHPFIRVSDELRREIVTAILASSIPEPEAAPEMMTCGDCGWSGATAVWRDQCKGFPCELRAATRPEAASSDEDADFALAEKLRVLAAYTRGPLDESGKRTLEDAAAAIETLTICNNQQDRPRAAALSISAGNSELEPDDRQSQRSRSPDRQGGKGQGLGGCTALLPSGLQCGERNVRRQERGDDFVTGTAGADKASANRLSAEPEAVTLREALEDIAGGFIQDGPTLAVEGRWKEYALALRAVALAALKTGGGQ
jgi:hypothetical protein